MTHTADSILRLVDELDELLSEEHEALRRLDHATLNQLTDRKVALIRTMSTVPRDGAAHELMRRLRLVRDRALTNQLLMVHARDLTRGVLDCATLPPAREHENRPRFLEVRG